jgi:hypothetical protein
MIKWNHFDAFSERAMCERFIVNASTSAYPLAPYNTCFLQ